LWNGNVFKPLQPKLPSSFTKNLPRTTLDGQFSIINGRPTFAVADYPHLELKLEERLQDARNLASETAELTFFEHISCTNNQHLMHMLHRLQSESINGLLLKKPYSKYYERKSTLKARVQKKIIALAFTLTFNRTFVQSMLWCSNNQQMHKRCCVNCKRLHTNFLLFRPNGNLIVCKTRLSLEEGSLASLKAYTQTIPLNVSLFANRIQSEWKDILKKVD
jgi:hypothetical protein